MNNLVLAVAGARKTQSIVNACSKVVPGARRLALTYTLTGQNELEKRLRQACVPGKAPEVMGWFAFLLRHCIRPYLPTLFPNQRLHGFNPDGEPVRGRYSTGSARYFDHEGRAYKLHLSKLAYEVMKASKGAVIDRISHIYNEIHIDEVQDLTGCDLHILKLLMEAPSLDIHMVGDVRQSVFDTNPQDPNLKQYRGVKMTGWFDDQKAAGLLNIQYNNETWRANKIIADFSDTLFSDKFNFDPTTSNQEEKTGHDGVFAIPENDVPAYMSYFAPHPLRASAAIAKDVDLPFRNFGKVKGATFDRVLIYPTAPITRFLTHGTSLAPKTACGLYVAVTRAKHSVVFVVPKPTMTKLLPWRA